MQTENHFTSGRTGFAIALAFVIGTTVIGIPVVYGVLSLAGLPMDRLFGELLHLFI